MLRLGGNLHGCRVLEVGCGRGYGTQLILDTLGAASVDAIDVDPAMIRRASRVSSDRSQVWVGNMVATGASPQSYDAVVDMGAMHLETRWKDALRETRRILKPGGRFYFEEVVRPLRQTASALATGKRLPQDFALRPFLDELEQLNFAILGLQNTRISAATGMVGDIIGVAAAPK
jgi:ubiquinone/menaquinone biosynthesis C-methylase UbiE